MDAAQLDQLVAQIGEEILSRLGYAKPAAAIPVPATAVAATAHLIESCPNCGHTNGSGYDTVTSNGAWKSRFDHSVAAVIDHTILKADATREDVRKVCAEARHFRFASVCVNGFWVPLVNAELAGTNVKVCTVVGFPLGAMTTEAKRFETTMALRGGAHEIDMVINVGALKAKEYDAVRLDIRGVVEAAHAGGAIVKAILETALLSDDEKRVACDLSVQAGADFVKTSTGFGPGGATAEDVTLMRAAVGPRTGVKASGGIRTLDDLKRMVAAGASRIGASASVKITEATAAG